MCIRDSLNGYRRAARASPASTEKTDEGAWVYDDAARWIGKYKAALAAFRAEVPDPHVFQQQITEQFASTGEMVGYVTQGTWRQSGTLSINIEAYREKKDGDWQWKVTDIDDHWTLGTSAPKPRRVAQNLMDSLQGRPIMTSTHLPKIINLTVETETPGINDVAEGKVIARPNGVFIESHGDRRAIEAAARNGMIAVRLVEINKIEGSSD